MHNALISKDLGDREVANQEEGMATSCTRRRNEACVPCSTGCVEAPGSASIANREGQEPSKTWMDLWPQKKKRQRY